MCFGEKFAGVRRRKRQDRISEETLLTLKNGICIQMMFVMFSSGDFTLEIQQECSSCPSVRVISV